MATIENGQNVFDIALCVGGSIGYAFEVTEKLGVSVTSNLDNKVGVAVSEFQDVSNEHKRILRIYKEKGIKPASNIEAGLREGIGFWIIELDFVVS